MWHGLSRAWFEEGMVCAGCGLSKGRRDIAGHGCEVWAGLGWSRAGVVGSGCGLSMVEQGVV